MKQQIYLHPFFPSKRKTYIRQLNEDSRESLLFLTAIQILLLMTHDKDVIDEMLRVCRSEYKEIYIQLENIDKLKKYEAYKAIEYYTESTCLFRVVNQVLRIEDIKEIFPFRGFITDLHIQLKELNETSKNAAELPFIVYRGKPLTPTALQQLIDNKTGFISMNGFLSTIIDDSVTFSYAGDHQVGTDRQNVLFELHVNTKMEQPYANISHISRIQTANELLFSVNTVWRIDSAEPEQNRWRIILSSCDELNVKLDEIQKQYTNHGSTLLPLGDILQELGDIDGAEWFYDRMLEQISLENETRVILNYRIGMIRKAKNDYKIALTNFEEALKCLPTSITESTESMTPKPHYIYSDRSYLLTIHSNRGFMYQKLQKIPKAIECYKQALNAGGSESERAAVHNDMGCLLFCESEYDQSYAHFNSAVELTDDADTRLPEYRKNLNRARKQYDQLKTHGKSDKTA
jgi:tetratricopeptide (TPR) repeat protein